MDKLLEMETRDHAILSASSSHRWLECTPSARAEEAYPDEGSDFAREGSLAHAIAAKKLKVELGLPYFSETAEIRALSEYLTGEMEEYTSDYCDFVMEKYLEADRNTAEGAVRPTIFIEKRLDFSKWVPEGFGTGDAVIVSDGLVEVIDFKYGKGVAVSAENNSQMMLYALGAVDELDYCYPFDTVRMTIYQPRIGNISTWECTVCDLERWAGKVQALASVAWRGLGARKSGEWCKFCRAKGDCPRLAADNIAVRYVNAGSDMMTEGEISEVLEMLPLMKDWAKAVEERSLELALSGKDIPGYKVVEGRSVRKITDNRGVVFALMSLGAKQEDLFKPMELKTLTELEKMFGKKEFNRLCGGFIEKPAGKPTLVKDSDKRKEINRNDFADLEF